MTRIAPAFAAAAALAFATPALAGDGPATPQIECGAADLLYVDAGELWITSDGLADATAILGGDYEDYRSMMWKEASDQQHGDDMTVKGAIGWMKDVTRGTEQVLLGFLGKTFDREADAYADEMYAVRRDMIDLQKDARTLKTADRRLRTAIRVLVNSGPPAANSMTLAEAQAKQAHVRDELAGVLQELRALRADFRKLRGAVRALEGGAEWADTMACVAERH